MSLKLKNFKGIKEFELNADGRNVSVYGDNATGKTSLVDAFMWLLFDKDSTDKKDFNIKTLTISGEPIHGLDHEVEAVLSLDGKKLSLKKVYAEKWTRKRGEAEKRLTGHTTEHFINGVPVKKSDYTAKVSEIADEEIFKPLTNVLYVNENLHWTKLRELLIEVCGDISDEDVIASEKSLEGLRKALEDYSIDEYRATLKASLKRLNNEIKKIPIRIDEVNLNKPDVRNINFNQVRINKQNLEEQNEALQDQINQLKVDDGKSETKMQIAELENQLFEVMSKTEREIKLTLSKAKGELSQAELKLINKRSEKELLQMTISNVNKRIKALSDEMQNLKLEFIRIRNEKPEPFTEDSTCPTCSQELPEKMIEEARQKHISQFNLQKAKRLKEINNQGKNLKSEKEALECNAKTNEETLKQLDREIASLDNEVNKLAASIKDLVAELDSPIYPSEYRDINYQIDTLKAKLENHQDDSQDRIAELQMLINTNKQAIQEMTETLAKEQQAKQADERIKQLMAEEKKLANEYAAFEQQDFLCEEFIKRKVDLLEEKINAKFELARFKLFEEQINGGIKEVCETMYNGVPYSDLNNGIKINIGLDIIRTLSDHYGLYFPIMIDNAESITKLLDTESQMIRLVVSEPDKQLRVEAE